MYPTVRCLAMASTMGGMRRILKNKGTVPKYIRQAVESGVYRSNEELEKVWKDRRESADDLATVMRRFRQDIVRGSAIQDYPVEYLILQQHPPIPDPPRVPKKLARRMKEQPNPTEKLVAKYLSRYERRHANLTTFSAPRTAEDYYRRLLGVAAPSASTSLGQKTAEVQRAYAAAVHHYQLQRTQGLSDAEAMRQVDDLLAAADVTERKTSRARAQEAQRVSKERSMQSSQELLAAAGLDEEEGESELADLMPSVLGSDPRKMEALMRWSDRLAQVDYREWTIGASTALDHWIARQVLGLSEESWESLLEGDSPELLSRGRDIVATREALFPETRMHVKEVDEDQEEADVDLTEVETENGEKSIEELLASLGGLKTAEKEESPEGGWKWMDEGLSDADAKIGGLVDELQEWRRKSAEKPFQEWSDSEQQTMNVWVKEYVAALSSDAEKGRAVDYEATRNALLSQPPTSREESEAFWSEIQDEAQAEALLDMMREQGPPPGASVLHAAFWDLPIEEQFERLLSLGALRPLLDDYTKESDRLKFLQRYGDTLLTGVQMEHLVPDPDGPVKASDLGAAAEGLGVSKNDRFRLEVLPYRSSGNMAAQERTRSLFAAWNFHKAGRARYEEKLFRTGRLGLRYGDRIIDDTTFPEDESLHKKS